MISIIVPVYNTEKYLHRCIDSILAQTFTDFELLLINDGSKDNSGKICDEYAAKDSRVRVFHKENGGVSSARNLGLNEAQGKWIYFVDSDDTLQLYALQELVNWINNDKIDLIMAGYYVYDENERIKNLCKLEKKKYRDLTNTYLVEGEHLVEEAYKSRCLKELLVSEDYHGSLVDVPCTYYSREVMKKISSMARIDCEKFMGTKVYLTTWVKVKENWRDSDFLVRNFGYKE